MSTISTTDHQQRETIHLLHVDDDPDLVDLTATFLTREDHRFDIEAAYNVSDGLDRLAGADFDCVISDYDMPTQNGIEFLEAVRDEYPDLPFILYTGKGSEEVASDAISAGVTDYLQKDSGTDHYTILANRVRNAVERYRVEREANRTRTQLQAIADNSADAIVMIDAQSRIRFANAVVEDLFGYTPAELQGESLTTIMPERHRDEHRNAINRYLETGERSVKWSHVEFPGLHRDGTEIPLSLSYGEFEQDGERRFVGIMRDISERIRMEKRRERIIERVTDAIVEVDADWRFTLVNEQAEDLYEMAREELLGRNFWEVFATARDTRIEAEYRKVMETRDPISLTEYFPQPDSWFEIEAYPKDDGGIAFYFREITEQRERQEALEQTNALLSTLFEGLPVGVLAEDASRNVLAANERLFELFQLQGAPEEHIGADCEQMAEQICEMFVDSEGFVEEIDELVESREPTDNEKLTLNDGRTFERSYRPITFPDGAGHLWMYRDITDGMERLETIRELHHRVQELMRADTTEEIAETAVDIARTTFGLTVSGVHLVDDAHDVLEPVAVTEEAREHLGEAPEYNRTDPSRTADVFNWEVFETGDPVVVDDTHTFDRIDEDETPTRSGITYPLGDHGVFITSSPEPNAFDETDRYLMELLATILTGALDRSEREAELREQKRFLQAERDRLEEFSRIVSHDLRNPLNVANTRLELAKEECESEHLDYVARAHDRMHTLIADLLTLAREGAQVGELESVDLETLTENCWQTVATGDATLVTDVRRTIKADRSRLQQLLENLMRNAIEHGGEEVTLTIGQLEDGFYVADNGPGIPVTERDDVFEAGYSTSKEGTGFGLSIVRGIVEAHDWEIRVTESDTGGTRLEITGVEFVAE